MPLSAHLSPLHAHCIPEAQVRFAVQSVMLKVQAGELLVRGANAGGVLHAWVDMQTGTQIP